MKKYILCLCLFLVLGLCSCKKDPIPDDPDIPNQPTLTKIQVVDEFGTAITEKSAYQGTNVYQHEGVYVLAYYSDDHTTDVTAFAKFSEVDLSRLGKTTVEVTYNNCKDSYILEVLENPVVSVQLDTTNVKMVYKVGERFSSSGLVVSAKYADGKTYLNTGYRISITDVDNQSINHTQPFFDTGRFDVTISVGTASSFFQILVYNADHANSDVLNITEFASALSFEEDGSYSFPKTTNILRSDYISMEATNTKLVNKIDGSNISANYDGKTYTKALAVSAEVDLKLTLYEDAEVVLCASDFGQNLVFRQNSIDYHPSGNAMGNCYFLYIFLEAGTYDVLANQNEVFIYDIIFGYVNESSVKLMGISIDKSKPLKTVYNLNDPIELDNISVLAYYSDESIKVIQSYELVVIIMMGDKEYAILEVEGTYDIILRYGPYSDSFQIQVLNIKEYKKLEIDTTEAVLEFKEAPFHTEGLKLYAVKADGTKDLIDSSEYDAILIYDEHIVTDFISEGTYEVRIAYKGLHTITTSNYISYTITYAPNK
ncbi:MAG: hypothetical protein K2K15_03070 [Anaeroplasmataceae bacterium]|nr:hypothetical protein [Anaeroplasmataceae bacterium]